MKPARIFSRLIILTFVVALISCQPQPDHGSILSETASILVTTEQQSTPTHRPTIGTPIGWTGNEVQPQEYVYPTDTPVTSGGTVQPSQTPRPSSTVRYFTPTFTATNTSRPTGPTQTPTKTQRFTPTGTLQTGWEGEWVVYYGPNDSSLETGSMTLIQEGRNFSATVQFGSLVMELTGSLTSENLEASGTYTHPTDPGWFYWKLITEVQFGGVLNNEQVFCANRPGGQKPNPCGIYPSS